MKKRYLIFVAIFILTTVSVNLTNNNELNAEEVNIIDEENSVKADELVTFNDPALEQEVANELGVNVGEIT